MKLLDSDIYSIRFYVDLSNFDPDIFFTSFDYYETYEEGKNYQSSSFEFDYGYGNKTYYNHLYIISDALGNVKEQKYIVASVIPPFQEKNMIVSHWSDFLFNEWNRVKSIITYPFTWSPLLFLKNENILLDYQSDDLDFIL